MSAEDLIRESHARTIRLDRELSYALAITHAASIVSMFPEVAPDTRLALVTAIISLHPKPDSGGSEPRSIGITEAAA